MNTFWFCALFVCLSVAGGLCPGDGCVCRDQSVVCRRQQALHIVVDGRQSVIQVTDSEVASVDCLVGTASGVQFADWRGSQPPEMVCLLLRCADLRVVSLFDGEV